MLALKPCTLTPSQREPNKLPQLGSFGRGMYLVHICWTNELIPMVLGSHLTLPAGAQLDPVCMLKSVGTGGFATGSALHAALQTLKCSMPLRMLAEGTALSIVAELAQRKPS